MLVLLRVETGLECPQELNDTQQQQPFHYFLVDN